MRTIHAGLVAAAVCIGVLALSAGAVEYDVAFSTFLGGSDWEHARDVCSDAAGNVYVVGGTGSGNFPTTPGAYQRILATGGSSNRDAFVAKFGPTGDLIWSTYLGGPDYDRAYAVEVDADGYVYVAGRAGPGFPIHNALQPTFQGSSVPGYGYQNAFVTKLAPDGGSLLWSTYIGVAAMCRDLDLDADGDVYVPLGCPRSGPLPPAEWFTNAYQSTPAGGNDSGIVKIRNDGSAVEWATWLGGTADDSHDSSIRVDAGKNVHLLCWTQSDDIPTTPGAAYPTQPGSPDLYLAKVSPDGSQLIYGTYVGGSGGEVLSTHNLALDGQGNAYVTAGTNSPNWPTTPGALQTVLRGGQDWGIAKFSPTGALLAGTFIGGDGTDGNTDGVYVDADGNVMLTGTTISVNFPTTPGAYQTVKSVGRDAAWVLLKADFSEVLYGTFVGGVSDENGRCGFLDEQGNVCMAGETNGAGWPAVNAYQGAYAGGDGDSIVIRFEIPEPATLAVLVAGAAALPRRRPAHQARASGCPAAAKRRTRAAHSAG